MEQTQGLRWISWPGRTFWLSLTPCQPAAKVPTAFRSSIKTQPWNSKRYFLASAIFLLLQLLASFSYLTISTRCGPPPHCGDMNPTICGPSPLHTPTGQWSFCRHTEALHQARGLLSWTLYFGLLTTRLGKRNLNRRWSSPLSPSRSLWRFCQEQAIVVIAFQEKQQCFAKSAGWQPVGIGFLC